MQPALLCLLSALLLASSPQAGAQTYYDFSTPMTGKSKYVFNVDGTPVDLGPGSAVPPVRPMEPEANADVGQGVPTLALSSEENVRSAPAGESRRRGWMVGVALSAPSGGQRSAAVRTHLRQDGTVARAPTRRLLRFRR
jgi:hypothetical protein